MRWLLFFLIYTNAYGSVWTQETFSKSIDINLSADSGVAVEMIEEGYLILAGSICEYDCMTIVYTDLDGNTIWNKQLINPIGKIKPADNYGNHGILINEDDIYICGIIEDENAQFDMFVYKTNINGDSVWLKNYGDSFDENLSTIIFNSDTSIILFADKAINSKQNDVILLLEIDFDGKVIQEMDYSEGFSMVGRQDILKLISGDVVFTHITCGEDQECDLDISKKLMFTKIDNLGGIVWSKTIVEFNEIWANSSILQLEDGGYLVSFYSENTNQGWFYPPIIFKIDSSGIVKNVITFQSDFESVINDLTVTSSGIIVGTGYIDKLELGFAGWIFGMNQEGEILWNREIVDNRYPAKLSGLNAVIESENNGLLLTGFIIDSLPGQGQNSFNQNIWLLKLDSSGCLKPGCEDLQIITSSEKRLVDNHNVLISPTVSSEQIQVFCNFCTDYISNDMDIQIFNVDGRQVIASPITSQPINISSLETGMYILAIIKDKGELIYSGRFIKN